MLNASNKTSSVTAEQELANVSHREFYMLRNGEQGESITKIEVTVHPMYKCAVWIEAIFYKTVPNAGVYGEQVEIGHCIAHLIDKSSKRTYKSELSNSDLEYSETRKVMQTLYNAAGARRPLFRQFAEELAIDRILHLDTLMMKANARGTGLGRIAMDQFLRLMNRLPDQYAFSGTVVLSPGRVDDQDYGGKSDHEVESDLIAFYSKCGFTLYVRGDRYAELNSSLSIMGRTT